MSEANSCRRVHSHVLHFLFFCLWMLDGSLFSAVRPSSICIPKLEAHSITSAPLSVMCYYITLMLAGLATYLHSHILNFHSPALLFSPLIPSVFLLPSCTSCLICTALAAIWSWFCASSPTYYSELFSHPPSTEQTIQHLCTPSLHCVYEILTRYHSCTKP